MNSTDKIDSLVAGVQKEIEHNISEPERSKYESMLRELPENEFELLIKAVKERTTLRPFEINAMRCSYYMSWLN